jgi:hypothetical protein
MTMDRTLRVPLAGRVASVSDSGHVSGDESDPISPLGLFDICQALDIPVDFKAVRMTLLDFDARLATATIRIRSVPGTDEAALQAAVDAIEAARIAPDAVRQALIAKVPEGERGRLEFHITAKQREQL